MNFKNIVDLFRETIIGCSQQKITLHAAAIAYFAIFSLAPLLIITVGIAGMVLDQAVVTKTVVDIISDQAGPEIASVVPDIIKRGADVLSGGVTAIIGLLIFVYAASLVFYQLRMGLNAMWGIEPEKQAPHQQTTTVIRTRLGSTLAALSLGFFLVVALIIYAFWVVISQPLLYWLYPDLGRLGSWLGIVVLPIVLYTVLIGIVFKWLPQAMVRWRDVWPGAILTAIIFWVGSFLVGLYLGRSWISSIYGAAGSLVVVFVWIFFVALIILFGAKFTQVYANKFGTPIVIDKNKKIDA